MRYPLGESLVRLEDALEADDLPFDDLAGLGEAEVLGSLFLIEMATLIRRGPQKANSLTPGGLISSGQAAAGRGLIPLITLADLRRFLERLEERARSEGVWDAESPMWWHPLPELTRLESIWSQLEIGVVSLDPEEISETFDEGNQARWIYSEDVLVTDQVQQVGHELEQARRAGKLGLDPGGVGLEGEISSLRADYVAYLTGYERDWLKTVPGLSVLVQWGLARWIERLGLDHSSSARIVMPQCAMLAWYPAPSGGYARHLDNPGGAEGNGRIRTLVVYLNPINEPCAGGELALWTLDAASDSLPDAIFPPAGGALAMFDSLRVPHQVFPLADGPGRWALTFWLNSEEPPRSIFPRPKLSLDDVLRPFMLPATQAPAFVPAGKVLLHEITAPVGDRTTARKVPGTSPRIGLVSTVFRVPDLEGWCRYHLSLGFDRLVLIFDQGNDPQEKAAAEYLRSVFPAERLILWTGDKVAEQRWPQLFENPRLKALEHYAREGASAHAVACRQSLNATAALAAARSGELGCRLDWLLHLDSDELFHLQGTARGGSSLSEHFAAVSLAGFERVCYLNHELLSVSPGGSRWCFKINPGIAQIHLGARGWKSLVEHLDLAQTSKRPYFQSYLNGKSAVLVSAGTSAAGVHGWYSRDSRPKAEVVLSGPSILHLHRSSAEAFRRKYLTIASAPPSESPRLFPPSPVEERAMAVIDSFRRESEVDQEALRKGLDELFHQLNAFSERDLSWLEEAGLLYWTEVEDLGLWDC